ncbi:MAG: serine/threonine protein kinase [Alphaproteobacteria bacterium]|nr:serine/threonine protein kinase [Alphaproteobacteria bacterium]
MADDLRRFHIRQCLGSGGFGEVYLARMASPGGVETEVAVKVLHEGLDPRSQAVQRLRDEGRLLGSLNHPAVLKVRDLVMLESRVALVMEYVPGLDLEGCFDSRPAIPMRAGLEVCARVADALKAAYEALGADGQPLRLVHRDIKPSNIRVGMHGDVKLLDFGIAKASDVRREAKTQTRMTLGSPWYMAPERFDRVNDDPASDVYALGCTLYEVASGGKRLFEELSARDHFLLAVDPGRHDAHLASHFDPLGMAPKVRSTLEAMLAWERTQRPKTHDLGPHLEDLAEELPGLSLRKWVREVQWPDPPNADGALVGRVLTEHRISHIVSPSTPAPAPQRGPGLEGLSLLGSAPANEVAPETLPPEGWDDEDDVAPVRGPTTAPTLQLEEPSEEVARPEPPPLPAPPIVPPNAPPVKAVPPPLPDAPLAPARRRSGGNPLGWTVGILGITLIVALVGFLFVFLYFVFTLILFTGLTDDPGLDTGIRYEDFGSP